MHLQMFLSIPVTQKCQILSHIYTGCPRRKGPNFGRVFLRSNCTDITQNTYIQSSMVTEILAREKCGLLWCLRNVLCPWRRPLDLQRDKPAVAAFLRYRKMQFTATTLATLQMFGVYSGWKSVDNCDTCASVFVVLFNVALCHSQVTLMLCTDINITETTYSCQFQYVFGNQ